MEVQSFYNNIETEQYSNARQNFHTHKDAKEALKLFPRRCVAEISILRVLSQEGKQNDALGALNAVNIVFND